MSSKGTIIYIGGFELPDRNAAAHQVLNNARILRSIGYDVVFSGVDKEIGWDQPNAHFIVDGFESYPVPYPKSSKQWISNMSDFSHVQRLIEKCDNVKAVIAYNVHAVPLRKAIKYCKKRGIKIIANSTEWYENDFSIKPVDAIKWLDTILVMRVIQKRVDGTIAVSEYLKKYYQDHVKDIVVMPPFVDVKEDKWVSSVSHNVTECPEFIYSGSIDKDGKKDKLIPIINSFYELKSQKFHFSIVGITEKDFVSQIPEMKSKLVELGDKISFYGRVPHNVSINKLKEADYCIFIRDATRKNMAGFPTKFVESITSGVYIIASNISDIERYFPEDGRSVLLKDNSPQSILEAIRFAVSQDTKALAEERRDGLKNNPFYYMNWQDKMNIFISTVLGEE